MNIQLDTQLRRHVLACSRCSAVLHGATGAGLKAGYFRRVGILQPRARRFTSKS